MTTQVIYTVGEYADIIGVHRRTVSRWIASGHLHPKRFPSGRPYFTYEDLPVDGNNQTNG